MIGTMNLHMTIRALLAQHLLGGAIGRNSGSAVNATGVEVGEVALLAQVGLACNQQVFIIGTMGCVAVGAIFLYRGVLPQERPALFSVAVIALFVDRVANQVSRSGAAVGIVAVGAGHQADMRHG